MSEDEVNHDQVITEWNPRRSLNGFSVGVLCIDSHYPIIPGNVQHAKTFPFPVLYGVVDGVELAALFRGDPELQPRILAAGQALIQQGVSAIVGACGSFGYYQTAAVAAFRIPTCMSVLTQVPHLLSLLPQQMRLAIYFASQAAFTERIRVECQITAQHCERLVITEALTLPAFRRFAAKGSMLDVSALGQQLFDHALALRTEHPDIGGVLLQCSDLPPFAHILQRALRAPVFDVTLIVEWMSRAALRHSYADAPWR